VSFGARAPYLGARSSAIVETPAKKLPEPETAGPHQHRRRRKTPVLTRPVSLDGIEAGSRSGKGGFGWRFSRTKRTARDCVDQSPGRRPICARKAHLSLTGGARVIRAKPLFPSTTGLSPAPHKSGLCLDKETASKPPAKCFARGVLVWWETLSSSSSASEPRIHSVIFLTTSAAEAARYGSSGQARG
jgi:hypothetical protein